MLHRRFQKGDVQSGLQARRIIFTPVRPLYVLDPLSCMTQAAAGSAGRPQPAPVQLPALEPDGLIEEQRQAMSGRGPKAVSVPPMSPLDVDEELWEILDLCTDEELELLHSTLHASSPFSPVSGPVGHRALFLRVDAHLHGAPRMNPMLWTGDQELDDGERTSTPGPPWSSERDAQGLFIFILWRPGYFL